MSLSERSARTERRVGGVPLALGVAAVLAWVALVYVLPGAVLGSVPTLPAVLASVAALTPVSYLLVGRLRDAERVTLETFARAVAVPALLFGVGGLVSVALVLGGDPGRPQ